jgi:hypothetical protein
MAKFLLNGWGLIAQGHDCIHPGKVARGEPCEHCGTFIVEAATAEEAVADNRARRDKATAHRDARTSTRGYRTFRKNYPGEPDPLGIEN